MLFIDFKKSSAYRSSNSQKFCKDLPPTAFIATLTGRYYALDRDNRWDRVKKAYYAMILGQAEKRFPTAQAAIEEGYRKCLSDEFLPACTIADAKLAACEVF